MSLDACADIVRRGDPDRFLATMAAPVEARARLLPLFAFNVEVARAPWVSQEPMICEMRLQWWHDALTEIAEGAKPRAHEVVSPLAEAMRVAQVPVDPLQALVTARMWDVHRDPFEDRDAFDRYLDATAGGLMWTAARSLGTPASAEGAVRSHGWGAGLAAFLRAIPELEARGRRPLPDGRPEAVAALAQEGLARASLARAARIPAAAVPALRTGWRSRYALQQAARDPAAVAEGRLGESEFARRATLLWLSLSGRW
jgi:phytoene/squalene synthetase